MYNYLLIRYGEIGLKGKNRSYFEKSLVKNMQSALKDLEIGKIKSTQGRMYIPLSGSSDELTRVLDRVTRVFGIETVSPAVKVESDLEVIKKTALQVFKNHMDSISPQNQVSFKVDCRRADKLFSKNSMEMNQILGAHILDHVPGLKVDVKQPQILLQVEIREDGTYIFTEKIPGHGGLPIGTTGKGVLMLSGGIDSPVAGWLAMKRGIQVVGLHFHSYPFTSQRALKKVEDISQVLSRYGTGPTGGFKLITNHFTDIQKAIQNYCSESMWVTVMRRFMFYIANRMAQKEQAMTVVTGENVGQVASQTLESMHAVSQDVVNLPILRPLAGLDKKEIMSKAETIGTYDISIRPYEDCCTLFLPKNPKTRPSLEQTKREISKLNFEELVEESLEKTEIKYFEPYQDITEEELTFDV
ncbi:tRNA uracil 4-sulfurtransferase ThiI [Natranaerobius thermophilus]|uniref:Probable tRNA sulfurtransferase n=1 Tax=Natranaerobius thermophilus (strain ATCC BAA-1301 / DSM 18059 / JW/NM-WN-LF) TaxID=457570 RepID=THII_NATTJ|nr:tRNA uracil 4-sulfurtransferase ThiI [Natranaerobius thermophilus]B2A8M8.1 RecName: Full=Probable tRNA sulfurtransferase; AltName: Full=Sulfur carrier protein ThiS sulfurtransferase; AltName: Full=Thiamine biosynthesis protein ThiI; AltName: Full=tRNA 4-thiouridine synthase [Natranaerobius thermophilus JW/NM-WN-LF]ACB85916.1 thiamine biosynthesis/tRNA modification protein ThiI [Natranaerobius thermophilus JW/NM-WN-LF]